MLCALATSSVFTRTQLNKCSPLKEAQAEKSGGKVQGVRERVRKREAK